MCTSTLSTELLRLSGISPTMSLEDKKEKGPSWPRAKSGDARLCP